MILPGFAFPGLDGPSGGASARWRAQAMAALFTGLGAGACLFIATVSAAKVEGASAGLPAAVQAAGVAFGAFAGTRAAGGRRLHLASATMFLIAAAACAGLVFLGNAAGGWQGLVLLTLVGVAVGVGVAANDAVAAARSAHAPARSVLQIGLFAALGAVLAPVVVQAGGTLGYAVPGAAFLGAAAAWLLTGGEQTAAPDRAGLARLGPLVIMAFLFGFIDNGVLGLAPAFFVSGGAGEATAVWIGVAAAAGAAVVQLAAVAHSEHRGAARSSGLLLYTLSAAALCLVLLALAPGAAMSGLLLVGLGVAIDVIYGLGLVQYLASAPPGRIGSAAALYACAAAVGETAGPLAQDALRVSVGGGGFYLAPAAVVVAAVLVAVFSRAAAVAATPAEVV